MSANRLIASEIKVLGSALATADNNTTAVVFDLDGGGSASSLYLPGLSNYDGSDRIAVVFVAHRASGTTSKISFAVYDAEADTDGSLKTSTLELARGSGGNGDGDPDPVVTNLNASGALQSAQTGHHFVIVGVEPRANRPWLRCELDLDDGTDAFSCTCLVLAIPASI